MSNDLLTVSDTLLDEMFELEVGCQSSHQQAAESACSVAVTHRAHGPCGLDSLVRTNAASALSQSIATDAFACRVCKSRIRGHWTVTPA